MNITKYLTSFLVVYSIMVSPMAFAKGKVSGIILDESSAPIDFASVRIFDPVSGGFLSMGVMTDENGRFTIGELPDGSYRLRVSNIGYKEKIVDFVISETDTNIGEIRLVEDAQMLNEVTIEGIRSQMKINIDKKVFTVDTDIASAGTSAVEMLESIPSVEVNQDGEISLRGDTSVEIWIDGKRSGLTTDNRSQILEQIPSENIQSVEIITNPSA